MRYYKIICNSEFIGIATSHDLRRFQNKHRILLICNEELAQYIQCNDILYHSPDWMKTPGTNSYEFTQASVLEITEAEYNTIFTAIESNEEIPVEQDENDVQLEEQAIDEVEELTVEFVKTQKISELSKVCNRAIENGFDVELSDNEVHHFSLTLADQMNISTLSAEVDAGLEFIPYHADGELCKYFTVEDVMEIINGAIAHKTFNVTWFNSLKAYVNSMDDIADISAVEYRTEIPLEFQSEVLRTLLGT